MNKGFRPVVLLVEDDSNDILLFQRAFGKLNRNADLLVGKDAYGAEELLMREKSPVPGSAYTRPSLIVLDLKLPGLSGLEFISWVRARPEVRRLPVIVFSSSSEPRDMNRAYEFGANSYLIKPAGFEALLETVKRLCDYWLELNRIPVLEAA